MLENLTSPVPFWVLVLVCIGISYDLRRKKNKPDRVKNTDNYFITLNQPVYRKPNQHELKLSNYGDRYEEALQSFREKKAFLDETDQLWKEASYEERGAAILDHMRYYQQYLNKNLAPKFLVELTSENWGHLNTYDSPVEALCLKIFRANQEVGHIEVQPDIFATPFTVDIVVKLNLPEFFEYSEIHQLFHCIARTHYNDDEPNNQNLVSVLHENLIRHLWNNYHGASTAKLDDAFNAFESEALQMTFTGTCNHYTLFCSAFKDSEADLYEAEMNWIDGSAEMEGLKLISEPSSFN